MPTGALIATRPVERHTVVVTDVRPKDLAGEREHLRMPNQALQEFVVLCGKPIRLMSLGRVWNERLNV